MYNLRRKLSSIFLILCLVASLVIFVPVSASEDAQSDGYSVSFTGLTDNTEELIRSLTKDVTIYYLTQGYEQDTNVKEILESYETLSSHISIVEVNPDVSTQFIADYTEEVLSDNSIIIECEDQNYIIAYEDMYKYDFDYGTYTYTETEFHAEDLITSAIVMVTDENLPTKIYTLTGHGEVTLTDTLIMTLIKEYISVDELDLSMVDSIPDDADCILVASPLTDFSYEEKQKLVSYLGFGGSAVIITDYTTEDLTNLNALLDYYGVELVDGIVLEGDSNYYYWQYPTYLIPEIESTEVSSDLADGGGDVLLVEAQGITTVEDIRGSVSVEPVLSTSQSAYSKTDVTSAILEKESGDIDGPFDLGVLITEEVEVMKSLPDLDMTQSEELQTKVAVYSSSVLINDSANDITSGGNYQLFTNTVNWACDKSGSAIVYSEDKGLK